MPTIATPANAIWIGGSSGTGTRAVAEACRLAGAVFGADVNRAHDARPLVPWYKKWTNAWLAGEDMDAAALELGEAVADYCRDLPLGLRWVCKNPRSHYVLPFLDQVVDGLRYIHVVRDGRDMAFSKQTGTLKQHCELLVGKPWDKAGAAHIAFTSWEVSNLRAAGYGEQRMGTRYLCVRLEQLCEPASRDASALAQFLGAPLDRVASVFEPQASFGRWRRARVDKSLAKLFFTSTALTHWGYA